jgi:tripartite-type tricarboxylate transporter receptor subunit TctC
MIVLYQNFTDQKLQNFQSVANYSKAISMLLTPPKSELYSLNDLLHGVHDIVPKWAEE